MKEHFLIKEIYTNRADTEQFDLVMGTAEDSSDIAGAIQAGWKTIWLNKNQTEIQNEGKKADLTVNTEEQLLKRIKRA